MEENLENNYHRLEGMMKRSKIDDQSSDIIISAIENRWSYHESLESHFARGLNQSSEGDVLSFVQLATNFFDQFRFGRKLCLGLLSQHGVILETDRLC